MEEPRIPRQIFFTDECRYIRDTILNSRNSYVWDNENLHAQHAHGSQQRFGINVWAGMVDDRLTGPYFLPVRLTGHSYLTFLQEVLGKLLEDESLDIRRRLWFQNDGAPIHFAGAIRDHLTTYFGQRWKGRHGPI